MYRVVCLQHKNIHFNKTMIIIQCIPHNALKTYITLDYMDYFPTGLLMAADGVGWFCSSLAGV